MDPFEKLDDTEYCDPDTSFPLEIVSGTTFIELFGRVTQSKL